MATKTINTAKTASGDNVYRYHFDVTESEDVVLTYIANRNHESVHDCIMRLVYKAEKECEQEVVIIVA